MTERTNIETRIFEAVQNMRDANRHVRISSLGTIISTAIIGFGTYGASEEKMGYIPIIVAGVGLLLKFGGDLLKYLNQRDCYRMIIHEERSRLKAYDISRSRLPVAESIEIENL